MKNKKVSIICFGKKGYDALSLFNKENFNYSTKLINVSDIDYNSTTKYRLANIIDDFCKG